MVFLVAVNAVAAQCAATTQKGTRCSRSSAAGSAYCWQHGGGASVAAPRPAAPRPNPLPPAAKPQKVAPVKRAVAAALPAPRPAADTRRVLSVTNGTHLVFEGSLEADLAGIVADDRATPFVSAFCGADPVRLEFETVNQFSGQSKVYVRKGGSMLNEEVVRAGLAGVDTAAESRYKTALLEAEATARRNRRGLWGE
jgi:hypothetical protein